ncbi:LPXTG cell wall anchor domain-containing protein [Streptomyces globosus]|uniref:LPXTG cell wall anchor domain-containing protein n=1 Tax=Streptomyces globosus TaxID=68209 RepID=A0A344U709_9ACTN|nr:LPXTG cell wall anchor domain-containing protein [Streptomyces globosus]AXE26680.1 LPXTG cell wall anchor domain-containing protein [Streptomyces globosus]
MPISPKRWAVAAVPAAASLLLAAGAAPAFADGSYTIPIHQDLPLTATSKGVENKKTCADIPSTQDGWHFVLTGNSTTFVKLKVTFEPGGEKVVTVFGPPSDKHAYVASEPGAKLTAASAEVTGGSVKWFNLSHTCPASATASPSPSVSSGAPSPSGSPSSSASASSSPSSSASPSASASSSASPSGTPSDTPSGSPAPSGSASAPASGGTTGGGLANTGSDAPVGLIAGMAAALVGAGAFLVVRRRRAGAEG